MSSYRIACNQLVLGCRYPSKVFFIIIWLSFLSVQFVFYFFLRSCAPPTAEFVIQKGEWGLLPPPKKKREEEIDSLWRARDLRKERKYNSVRNIYDDVGCPPLFFSFVKSYLFFPNNRFAHFCSLNKSGCTLMACFSIFPLVRTAGVLWRVWPRIERKKKLKHHRLRGCFLSEHARCLYLSYWWTHFRALRQIDISNGWKLQLARCRTFRNRRFFFSFFLLIRAVG